MAKKRETLKELDKICDEIEEIDSKEYMKLAKIAVKISKLNIKHDNELKKIMIKSKHWEAIRDKLGVILLPTSKPKELEEAEIYYRSHIGKKLTGDALNTLYRETALEIAISAIEISKIDLDPDCRKMKQTRREVFSEVSEEIIGDISMWKKGD